MKLRFPFCSAFFLISFGWLPAALLAAPPPATAQVPVRSLALVPEGKVLLDTWRRAGYQFSPEVRKQWFAYAKALALRDIAAAGKSLPDDFIEWVDGDPVVAATVYGARQTPANVMLMLRSLELDLGEDVVRKDYTQFALAMAVVHADKGPEADLSPRELAKIVIPGDPRKPVDTQEKGRLLDRNDHIINFLKSRTIEEDVVVGQREEDPPLKYDSKGIAIPPPKNAKKIKVAVTEKATRTLYAADVLASKELQADFNAYMKAHGEDVSIDCGDKVVSWNSKAAVRAERKQIADAFILFRTAYEAKGLLPAARDPFPTPAESMAWLIRNDRFRFPVETAQARNWPRYPLNAPWPTLTLLAADNQPLREREERWTVFRDEGVTRTYGEYIGAIAQQFDMQSARRLTPYPFQYGTYQMMAKDGGVCGTMANMGVRTYETLGIPSCTAGQPGHCALILFAHDAKSGLYECRGGQFATGGPDKTSPHTPWIFGDVDARKPMIYYQTIAWAVNHGIQGYLDSTAAYQMFRALPEADRAAHGQELLESALALNPYNILLTDAAQAKAATPQAQIRFWKAFSAGLAATDKPGCPKDGLYSQVVKSKLFASLAKLPPPSDTAIARAVLDFMGKENCTDATALVSYQVALGGLPTVMRRTESAFKAHLATPRTDAACQTMAATLTAVAGRISDKKEQKEWTLARWKEIQGHEDFFGAKYKITTDASATALAKLTRAKLAPDTERLHPLLMEVSAKLKAQVAGERQPKECASLATWISATAKQIKDPAQSCKWLEGLAAVMAGREDFKLKNGKLQRDPCATAISNLLAASATAKS